MMDIANFINEKTLQIVVKPGCPKSEIMGWDENINALKVNIAAKPEKDKANAEVRKFFSKLTGKRVRILKGKTIRKKVIEFY